MENAIKTEGLTKKYKEKTFFALADKKIMLSVHVPNCKND